jgi:hypothetical protein
VFINNICHAVAHSKYLLLADDMKIYQAVKSSQDCSLLQSDVNSMKGWCIANYMKLKMSKTRVISFSRKTKVLIYDYKICRSSITWTDSINDLGVFIYAKLYFHDRVNYIFSHCSITFIFSFLECMLGL